ncbi:MAG: pyridoxal-phosphate-dependent aminotransferase family protein [Bacteroidota bacterium]
MKKRLFTPGPTPVPEHVQLRMAEPMIHHRHPEFQELFSRVNKNLQYLFQTSRDVLTLTSSGTGAMEAAVCNLHSPGETAIYVNGGKFGERWGEILKAYGVTAVESGVEWGSAIVPEKILETLKENPNASAVYLTHSETSTAVVTDVKNIAALVRQHSSALTVVDGITAIGAMEFRMDAWGIDVVVTGSQKGLMIPPGLAFIALSDRAAERMERSKLPKYYFSLSKARKALRDGDTPWTPAVSLLTGLDAALEMIRAEGIEQVWARHARLAGAVRAAVQALGLKLFASAPSNALTGFWIPERIEAKKFNDALKKTYGITIAGGQGHLAGKIVRISHLGYYDELDIVALVAGLEMALRDCGYACEPGAGVQAAQRAYFTDPTP